MDEKLNFFRYKSLFSIPRVTNRYTMQFTTLVLTALVAVVTLAAPRTAVPRPDILERQVWCGACDKGETICCDVEGCYEDPC